MDEASEKKGVAQKAVDAGREVIEEVGEAVDEIVAEAPALWEKAKRAAGSAAAEVQDKGPGLWAHVKSVAAETAEAFDRGFAGDDEEAKKSERGGDELSAGEPAESSRDS